jgi:hypothetical protein
MTQYFCGNPICKKTIVSESVDWPLRCGHCNQQCYPEDFQPASSSSGGSSILTQDDGFRLPGAILMIRGPSGTLVPFRSSTRGAARGAATGGRRPDVARAEPSADASLDRLLALVESGESAPEPAGPRKTPGKRPSKSERPDTTGPSRDAGTTTLAAGSSSTRGRALVFGGVALALAAIVFLLSRLF